MNAETAILTIDRGENARYDGFHMRKMFPGKSGRHAMVSPARLNGGIVVRASRNGALEDAVID